MEKERAKLCVNCDARIPITSEQCPYCGSDFSETFAYAPSEYKQQDFLNFQPLYTTKEPYQEEESKLSKEEILEEKKQRLKQKSILLTILLLSIGSMFFTLGLLVFFFSENGKLILEWKSRYALVYCLIAAPMLYIGWLRLKNE